MKLPLKHILAAVILVLSFAAPAWSQTNVMQFVAHPPDAVYETLMGAHAWRIYATGEIDAAADKRLAALIANKHIPQGSMLYLHSPGGSLPGGMVLGPNLGRGSTYRRGKSVQTTGATSVSRPG